MTDAQNANAIRLLESAIEKSGDPTGARAAKLAELQGIVAADTTVDTSFNDRDYEAEIETANDLGITDLDNISDIDRANLFIATYGYDKLPADAQSLIEQLQAASGSPAGTDLSALQGGISDFGMGVADLQTAATDQQAGVQGSLNVLQKALRMSGGVGNQPTGPLTSTGELPRGMSALSIGFQNRLSDIDYRYDSFANVIQEMGTAQYADAARDLAQAENLWNKYSVMREDYKFEQDRLDQLERDATLYEQELDIIERQHQNNLERDRLNDARAASGAGIYSVGGGAYTFDNTSGLPSIQTHTGSIMGDGTITGYGSYDSEGKPIWEWGLDFVLDGGKGAEVGLPFSFEVTEVDSTSGFGNRVKIKTEDGQEMWFSHLDEIITGPGSYEAGTVIGTQGNTGRTFSTSGGDGTHLDVTMPNGRGGYYTAEEVASYMGVGSRDATFMTYNVQSALEILESNPTPDGLAEARRALQTTEDKTLWSSAIAGEYNDLYLKASGGGDESVFRDVKDITSSKISEWRSLIESGEKTPDDIADGLESLYEAEWEEVVRVMDLLGYERSWRAWVVKED